MFDYNAAVDAHVLETAALLMGEIFDAHLV